MESNPYRLFCYVNCAGGYVKVLANSTKMCYTYGTLDSATDYVSNGLIDLGDSICGTGFLGDCLDDSHRCHTNLSLTLPICFIEN